MTYQMNPAQFKQVISLPPEERYLHFLTRVTDWEEIWTLRHGCMKISWITWNNTNSHFH